MQENIQVGQTVYIEHGPDGDVYYRVKIVQEKQPSSVERCRVCLRGDLDLMGHLVQQGFLDDKVYAYCRCGHCCAITVFIYHVHHSEMELPEKGVCHE